MMMRIHMWLLRTCSGIKPLAWYTRDLNQEGDVQSAFRIPQQCHFLVLINYFKARYNASVFGISPLYGIII